MMASLVPASGPGPGPGNYARIRPSTDSNPLVTRRRPTRPANAPRDLASSTRASQWAAPSASAIAAQKANTINDADWIPYKLTTTKASLLKSLRHHIIRLHPKRYEDIPDPNNPAETISVPRKVDLLDPTEFARPIRLHRRNPCAPLGGLKEAAAARLLAKQTPAYDEVKDVQEELHARKAASRAEIASKVAPYGADNVKKKSQFAKKTEQVFQRDQSNVQMRYEESQPWFIEDFDNGNTWQGQREQNLSGGRFVALLHNRDSMSFNMVPIEKWYKFREVNKFKMTSEEAVERKRKLDGVKPPWIKVEKKAEVDEPLTAEEARLYQKFSRLIGKGVVASKGSEEVKATADLEEVDYEQEFDNDDAGQLYGVAGDDDEDEQKATEKRVKKNQLSANNGFQTRRVYEEDNVAKTEIAAAARTHGRKTRKFLRNHEGNNNYDSDSDSNPYASSQEDDEDEIAAHAEAVKIKVEARLKADEDRKAAQVALEAKKVAEIAERRAKAAEKRKENTGKKKVGKALEAAGPLPAVSAGLIHLGKKAKVTPAAATIAAPTEKEVKASRPSGSNKRTSGHITGFDSGSERNEKSTTKTKVSNKTVKLKVSASPPASPRASPSTSPRVSPSTSPLATTHKRKHSTLPEELKVKKQRAEGAFHSPSPVIAGPDRTTPNSRPVTDEDLKAILRSHPGGITMKGIADLIKGRVKQGEIKAVAVAIKRLGRLDLAKGKYVLKDGLT